MRYIFLVSTILLSACAPRPNPYAVQQQYPVSNTQQYATPYYNTPEYIDDDYRERFPDHSQPAPPENMANMEAIPDNLTPPPPPQQQLQQRRTNQQQAQRRDPSEPPDMSVVGPLAILAGFVAMTEVESDACDDYHARNGYNPNMPCGGF